MKRLFPLALTLLASVMTACSGNTDVDETLRTAEMAIARGDMTAATSVARTLTDSTSLSKLSPRQLGRLSIIYMQLADSVDNVENVAIATDAYRRAFNADSDSADEYYSSLNSDKLPYSMMLQALTGSQDNPADLDADEPADTAVAAVCADSICPHH